MGAQGHAGDDAERAAAALERPEEVGIGAGVGDLDVAVGGHDLRLQEARRGHAIGLRPTSEAAALDQTGDADRHAAAALDVATSLGGDRVVDTSPDRAGPDRCGRLRRRAPFAAGAEEGVVQDDGVHMARPDEQGVRRVRRSLVAVAAALHHQPQIVVAGEIYRGDDVFGSLGSDRVCARPRRPCADPAERLRQPDFVAEKVGILELPEDLRAGRGERHADAGGERRAHLDQTAADVTTELFPA